MNAAAKANVVISLLEGAMVAGIAALLGSPVWWLWGLCFAGCASMGLACVQIASEIDQRGETL